MSNTLATPSTMYDPNWYPDLGATHHMTLDPLNLMEKADYGGSKRVVVGNGSSLQISHVGNSLFKSDLSNHSFRLNNLLHMPHITKNLLSVSQFAKDNKVFFKFQPNHYYVKCQDTKEIILQGSVDNGLYKILNFNPTPAIVPVAHFSSKRGSNFHLWHSKLGHPSPAVVSRVLKSCNLPFSMDNSLCSSCCLGKFHHLPFSISTSVYHSPLGLVYFDIWGPAPFSSINGACYYVHFIDAFSKYTWLYLIQSGSQLK